LTPKDHELGDKWVWDDKTTKQAPAPVLWVWTKRHSQQRLPVRKPQSSAPAETDVLGCRHKL
jgi:hypothetical protein